MADLVARGWPGVPRPHFVYIDTLSRHDPAHPSKCDYRPMCGDCDLTFRMYASAALAFRDGDEHARATLEIAYIDLAKAALDAVPPAREGA